MLYYDVIMLSSNHVTTPNYSMIVVIFNIIKSGCSQLHLIWFLIKK